MTLSPVLELASLSERHPDLWSGPYGTYPHGQMALIRLSLNPVPPTPLAAGTLKRSVTISHLRARSRVATETEQAIGWAAVEFSDDLRLRIENLYNDHQITEMAAIAVMGLLAHELEKFQLKTVVQVGGGGDYTAHVLVSGELIRIEVSGIREGHPSVSKDRLEEKSKQLLKHERSGFVSVTTFHQIKSGAGTAHSFLHHVESKHT